MRYGYFDDEHREYVITNPKTPVKWINYIGGLSFGGFVDQTGGALICKGDPSLNRITKYIPQLPASDFKGETLYLRFQRQTGRATRSSPRSLSRPSTRSNATSAGSGWAIPASSRSLTGCAPTVTIFVPAGGNVEIRDIQVTNLSGRPLEVDAIPVVEYTHPDALKQFTNADWVPQTMQSRAVTGPDGLTVLLQYPFMLRDLQVNYFHSQSSGRLRSRPTGRASWATTSTAPGPGRSPCSRASCPVPRPAAETTSPPCFSRWGGSRRENRAA